MSKAHSPVKDYGVYLVLRIVVCVLQAMPAGAACSFAHALAWLAHAIDRRHREVARENLRHAFPELMDTARERIVRGVYRHFCTLVVDLIQLPRRLHYNNWRHHMELPNAERFLAPMLSGRPVLFVTGHFGNWEMGGYILGLLGFKTYAIARPIDNPYIDDFLRRFRQRTGQGMLAKKGDFDQMQEILAAGGTIGTLADQDAGQRGLFVNFFGRPASTHKAVALLALEYGVPLVVVGTPRVGEPFCYRALVEDVIFPEEYRDQPDAVKAITQRFTSALERLIRRHPEQYFWLHRRWKHQPQAKKSKRAA